MTTNRVNEPAGTKKRAVRSPSVSIASHFDRCFLLQVLLIHGPKDATLWDTSGPCHPLQRSQWMVHLTAQNGKGIVDTIHWYPGEPMSDYRLAFGAACE